MSATSAQEQRVTDLEIKVSFMEDMIDKLDQVIIGQQHQLDALVRELLALRTASGTADGTPRHARDDLPPHY